VIARGTYTPGEMSAHELDMPGTDTVASLLAWCHGAQYPYLISRDNALLA